MEIVEERNWKEKLWRTDAVLALGCYLLSLVAFVPVIKWIAGQTSTHEQLLFPVGILALAVAYLFLERKRRLTFVFEFGKVPLTLLLCGYIAIALAVLTAWGLLMVPALCFILASLAHFIFGPRVGKIGGILLICFAAYVGVIIVLPFVDWPLRLLAGQNASYLLELFGSEAMLSFKSFHGGPELILEVDRRPFIVAAECNGFGVLSAAFLLSLLLALYRKIGLLDKVLYIAAAMMVAFVANILRILIIIYLAPQVGRHYMLMHEIVGTVMFWLAMGVVILLLPKVKPRGEKAEVVEEGAKA